MWVTGSSNTVSSFFLTTPLPFPLPFPRSACWFPPSLNRPFPVSLCLQEKALPAAVRGPASFPLKAFLTFPGSNYAPDMHFN